MSGKRRVLSAIIIFLLFTCICVSTSAGNASKGKLGKNLTWSLDKQGTLTISGKGPMPDWDSDAAGKTVQPPWEPSLVENVVIEDGVTSIGDEAFFTAWKLKKISISDSVTRIGKKAFMDAQDLTQVTIPGGVTEIDDKAFTECVGLRSVKFSEGLLRIGNEAFYSCSALPEIQLPESLTSIGDVAFGECTGLTEISIPGNVSDFGQVIFNHCTGLKTAVLQEGIRKFSTTIFYESGLESVDIPASAEDIGDPSFQECRSLKTINVHPDNPVYESVDGVLFSKSLSELYRYPGGRNNASYVIPDRVRIISYNAFRYSGLKSITIPCRCYYIAENAFAECEQLTEVNFGGDLPEWEKMIFEDGNDILRKAELHYIPLEIEWSLEDGILTISGNGRMADYDENSTPWNGEKEQITGIVIEEGINRIGDWCFANCSNAKTVSLPEGLIEIGTAAFLNCKGLENIEFPESLSVIGGTAFGHCYGLTGITIPEGITDVGYYSFYDCTGLQEINLPDSLTVIHAGTFRECTSLTSFRLPENLTVFDSNPLHGCSALTEIVVSPGNHNFNFTDGILFDASGTELLCYPGGRHEESYTVPDGVITLGGSCFMLCTDLKHIILPESIRTISQTAFAVCENLEEIRLPEGVESIGYSAFGWCNRLGEITLPRSIQVIEADLFDSCESVPKVYYEGTATEWESIEIDSSNEVLFAAEIHFGERK